MSARLKIIIIIINYPILGSLVLTIICIIFCVMHGGKFEQIHYLELSCMGGSLKKDTFIRLGHTHKIHKHNDMSHITI